MQKDYPPVDLFSGLFDYHFEGYDKRSLKFKSREYILYKYGYERGMQLLKTALCKLLDLDGEMTKEFIYEKYKALKEEIGPYKVKKCNRSLAIAVCEALDTAYHNYKGEN